MTNCIKTATLVLAIAWSLAAFAVEPGWDKIRGNDTGGIIPWSEEHELNAPEWAAEHCATPKSTRTSPPFSGNTAVTSSSTAFHARPFVSRRASPPMAALKSAAADW